MNAITVRIGSNYGCRAIYPACHTSKLIAQLAGTRTLTDHALAIVKQLGYAINVQQPTLTATL